MDFCLRCVSLKLTLALRTLGLGGIDSETSGSFLLFHKNEKSVFVGGGGGEGTRQAWPRKQGHVLCATARLPHHSWLQGLVRVQPASLLYLFYQIVPGHNHEGLGPFASVLEAGFCG